MVELDLGVSTGLILGLVDGLSGDDESSKNNSPVDGATRAFFIESNYFAGHVPICGKLAVGRSGHISLSSKLPRLLGPRENDNNKPRHGQVTL